jgi:hypothetical protein
MLTGQLTVQPYAGLNSSETGEHQDQVKVLIERTASSLDDTALKMLFVSVQQNNIELCVQYAINEYVVYSLLRDLKLTFFSLANKIGAINTVCPHLRNPNDYVRLKLIQYDMIWQTMLWFGHSLVSDHSIY